LLMSEARDWAPLFPLAVSAVVVTVAALVFHRPRQAAVRRASSAPPPISAT